MKTRITMLICSIAIAFIIPTTAESSEINYFEDYCEAIGDKYGICPELLEAMIFYESSGDPRAVSSCGAIGLMQIRPEYHQDLIDELGITDIEDPYQNILVGTAILADLAKRYEPYEALVAYNNGEYSKAMKDVQNGALNAYADKVLSLSFELERAHGK